MSVYNYTPEDFFSVKQNYKPNNSELDEIFNKLFNNEKKDYFKTHFSIVETKKNEVISYLNKITSKNVDNMITIIYKIAIEYNLTEFIIEYIFKLCTQQTIYCTVYVKTVKYFINNIDVNTGITDYIKKKCLDFKKISSVNSIKDNKELSYDEFCENNKLKIYKKGYSQFLGELFLNNIIDYTVISDILSTLLNDINHIINTKDDLFIEDIIICIDKLSCTLIDRMNIYDKKKVIKNLENIINIDILSRRLKFKIMDLKDKLQ